MIAKRNKKENICLGNDVFKRSRKRYTRLDHKECRYKSRVFKIFNLKLSFQTTMESTFRKIGRFKTVQTSKEVYIYRTKVCRQTRKHMAEVPFRQSTKYLPYSVMWRWCCIFVKLTKKYIQEYILWTVRKILISD